MMMQSMAIFRLMMMFKMMMEILINEIGGYKKRKNKIPDKSFIKLTSSKLIKFSTRKVNAFLLWK
jgi:hypothetical protein